MTTPEQHPIEFLAAQVPVEVVSIADEQSAAMANLISFTEAVQDFSCED